ncbi:protein kinase [Nocardia sp. NPDC050175]|uniref:protein kinase domain-containing protein n=1 Tax=Nocardia sp. NPDC050175 TaxID=3364317 RepID=UPI0037B891A2
MADYEEPLTGKRLIAGRYRVDGSLGRGGMSEVFYGYDERLDRQVAIKELKPAGPVLEPDSPEAVEILDARDRDRKRFLREIRTTARLEHPGIPAVYDTGMDIGPGGEPQLWLVIQLLRGSTLETVLDHMAYNTAPPSPAWAAAIAAQVAAVLVDVHRVDIVHRDIKPANLMLIDSGVVKVLDFGIAILRGAGELPRLTQVDKTVGTPDYMSPEQWLGEVVTPASDIYSLGCLLFEMLTGDVPFHGTKSMTLRTHHRQSPPPSSRARRADVPASVDQLVTAMMAKDPAVRPTAEAVYELLMPLTRESGGVGGDNEIRDPTRPFRQPLLAPPPTRDMRPGTGSPLTEAESEQVRKNVEALLDNDRPSEAIRLLEDACGRAEHDPFIKLRLRHYLAAALFSNEEYTRAASLFEAVGREYARYLPADDEYVLDCRYHAGHAYAAIGKPNKALPQLRFYVLNAHAEIEDEAERILGSRYVIAQMLGAVGYYDEAIAELNSIRVELVATYGCSSTHVRNLDKQIHRLEDQGP